MMAQTGTTPFLMPYSDRTAAVFALSQSPALRGLTPKLVEVAWLVADGLMDKQIAEQAGIHYNTVRVYRKRIVSRLNLDAGKRDVVVITRRVVEAWEWVESQHAA